MSKSRSAEARDEDQRHKWQRPSAERSVGHRQSILSANLRLQDQRQAEVHSLHRHFPRNGDHGRPEPEAKTLRDYVAEGRSFDEAIKAALAPMAGKTLVTPPQLSNRPFTEAAAHFSGVKWNTQVLENSKSLVLAGLVRSSSSIQGAPVVYSLAQRAGPNLGIGDLYEYAPGGARLSCGAACRDCRHRRDRDYVNKHRTHGPEVRRWLANHRRLEEGPLTLRVAAPYLNSVAGTELDRAGVEATVDTCALSRP